MSIWLRWLTFFLSEKIEPDAHTRINAYIQADVNTLIVILINL